MDVVTEVDGAIGLLAESSVLLRWLNIARRGEQSRMFLSTPAAWSVVRDMLSSMFA
jgi:hypothetical protein